VIEDVSKPDTEIHGLIATDILTKGFDVPDVLIGISARPFSKSLSSHIQQMGRIMRGCEGKEFAVWLDHSGNYLRFRQDWEDIYEHGVDKLDDGKEKTKPEPTDQEQEAAKCPACGSLWPSHSDACSNCGHVRERKNKVVELPGELQELTGTMSKANKQEWWSMLQWYVKTQGWSHGRAAHVYKEKFGVWPRALYDKAMPPSQEVVKFIDKGIRAYIRQMKRGR